MGVNLNNELTCIYNTLRERGAVLREPMCKHTSFRIGGEAAVYFAPQNEADLVFALALCQEKNAAHIVIGNGSNLLVSDAGIDAVVIQINMCSNTVNFDGNLMTCSSGTLLSKVAAHSVEMGFMGLEWAYGIPGTMGGAVAMNAGAYGGEIKQILRKVRAYVDGKICDINVEDGHLGYRKSIFIYPQAVVLSATMELSNDDGFARERMSEYTKSRKEKQPLKYPSAGSVFKRPKDAFAGQLIQNAGLMGYTIGGAQVSTLHAGFIVNIGNAAANDVANLIKLIKSRVFETSGIMLEEEIKLVGEF